MRFDKRNTQFTKPSRFLKLIVLFMAMASLSVCAEDLSSGLAGWWGFEGDASDAGAYGYKSVVFGSPKVVQGRFGKAFEFDGQHDYIQISGDSTSRFISQNGFSWAMWFKSKSIPSSQSQGICRTLFSVADEALNEDAMIGFGSFMKMNKDFVFSVDGVGGFGAAMDDPPRYKLAEPMQPDTWYFVVGVRDYKKDSIRLYINGVLADKKKFYEGPIDRNMKATIGAFIEKDSAQAFFAGVIDELKIYDRPLSAREVKAMFDLDPNQLKIDKDSLDFGTLACGADSTISVKLINNGTGEINITAASLKSGAAFAIANPIEGTLKSKESKDISILFRPSGEGIFKDTLTIKNGNYLPAINVVLRGGKFGLNYTVEGIDRDTIDFGCLCRDVAKDTSFTISVVNKSSMLLTGSLEGPFVFADSALSSTGKPFDSVETRNIPIRFAAASSDGVYTGRLAVTDPCGTVREILLKATVSKPDYVAVKPADTVSCPGVPVERIISVDNRSSMPLKISVKSSDDLFEVPGELNIAPAAKASLPVKFAGATSGGLHSADITLSGRCSADTVIHVNVDVGDIQISSSANEIDFGEIELCNPDTIITKQITITNKNVNTRPVKVSLVGITSDFSTSAATGDTLAAGIGKVYTVQFKPKAEGEFESSLEIVTDTCDAAVKVRLKGRATRFIAKYAELTDFGMTVKGEPKDTVIVFVNGGTAQCRIESTAFDSEEFKIMGSGPALPCTLNPGDTLKTSARYAGAPGKSTANLVITAVTQCGESRTLLPCKAEGVYLAKLTMAVSGVEGKAGDIVDVPVEMLDPSDVSLSNIKSYSVQLIFNPTIMMPAENLPGRAEGSRYSVNINIPALLKDSNATLAAVPFRLALGDTESDSVLIRITGVEGGLAKIVEKAGVVTIKNICREGGNRLFTANGTLQLAPPKPNPAGSEVEIGFELIERGVTRLVITDLNGSIVREVFKEAFAPGTYVRKFDISELNSGSYFFILDTPTQRLISKMQVNK